MITTQGSPRLGALDGPLSDYQRDLLVAVLRGGGTLRWLDDGPRVLLWPDGDARPRADSVKRLIRGGLLARDDGVLIRELRERGVKGFVITAAGRGAIA